MTVEQFWQLPEDEAFQYELHHGELVKGVQTEVEAYSDFKERHSSNCLRAGIPRSLGAR